MTPGPLEVQDSCYFWLLLLGSAAGVGEGSVLRAGQDPSSLSGRSGHWLDVLLVGKTLKSPSSIPEREGGWGC